jgi:hypothetical protein
MPVTHPSHSLVVVVALVLPTIATLAMEVAESLIETLGWKIRVARTGWDLCVLAVGSTGGVFTLPGVEERWGTDWSIALGLIALMVAFICGLFIIHLRKTRPEHVKGWQSLLAVGLGVASLVLPWYFVISS